MFAYSCCIVIGAFMLSRGGQICKSTLVGGARSQFRELSPLSPDKHDKLTRSLWCINYLWFFQPQPSACSFMHNMILRQVIMATQLLAAINPWYICYKWFEHRCEFSKENAFQNVYDEGFSPLSPLSRDDQGLPGLGEGLRWWLSWFRREQKDCPLV